MYKNVCIVCMVCNFCGGFCGFGVVINNVFDKVVGCRSGDVGKESVGSFK